MDTVAQIMELISKLTPEELEMLMKQLGGGAPAEAQGIVAPEAGPNGVPA